MQTLANLAKSKNRTIITTIHQPRSNIYTMFDNVILLADGQLVYFGNTEQAMDYFNMINHPCPRNYNPADHMIDVVTMNPHQIGELSARFKESALFKIEQQQKMHRINSAATMDVDEFDQKEHLYNSEGGAAERLLNVNHSPTNAFKRFTRPRHWNTLIPDTFHRFTAHGQYSTVWFEEVWILSKRTLLHNIRNPYLLRAQYILTVCLGILLGLIFYQLQNNLQGVQDKAGAMFFIIALFAFGSLSSIDVFFQERAIFLRERASGMYRTSSYFIAKALCDVVPMRVIPPIILGAIVYKMIGLHPGYLRFALFESTLVLASLVAASLCLAISAATPSLSLGNLIAILIMLFFMLFGGFLVNKTSMPWFISWIKWSSFLNYAFELLMVNEFENSTVIFDPAAYNYTLAVDGSVILKQFDMEAGRMFLDFGVLAGMAVIYLFGAYCFLRFFVKEQR